MFERCLYFNVNALARAVNRVWDEAFSEFDLSPAHAYLLRLVLANPGISQKAIGEELRLEKSTVTRFLDTLQRAGMVTRSKAGVGTSREQGVFPTGKARKLHAELERTGEKLYRRMISNFGEPELKQLVVQMRDTLKQLK
jgi:DNA-binding MarR family transcriptional regulator